MKLIYITGSHSSGKSSLLKSMKDIPNVIVFSRHSREELFNENEFELLYKNKVDQVTVFENLYKRLEASAHETRTQFKLANKESKRFIVADHFLPDCMAYIMTCYKLGWLNQTKFDILKNKFESESLNNIISEYYILFIKPSFKKVAENFRISNQKNSRFWETKTNYLETSYRMFTKIYKEYPYTKIISCDVLKRQRDVITKSMSM